MPPRKPGFIIEQHEQLGIELQKMRDKFPDIIVELSKAYPLKDNVVNLANRVLCAIDDLRSKMDDLVCREHHANESINVLDIYYRAGRDDYEKKR